MSVKDRVSGALKGGSSKRLLIVFVAITIAGGVWWMMSAPAPQVNVSQIRNGATRAETVQGQESLTPAMNLAISTADQQRLDEAKKEGGSAMPTIRAAETRAVDVGELDQGEADALDVPKRPEPPVVSMPPISAPPIMPVSQIQTPQNNQPDPVYQSMTRGLGSMTKPNYAEASVKFLAEPKDFLPKAGLDPYDRDGGSQQGVTSQSNFPMALPLPGTVLYAEMISEANSDAPGPVIAEIVQGELAGARLIGRFDANRDNLVISFNTLTMGTTREGVRIDATTPIKAYGVDTRNVGTALATSRDYHLIQNVGLTFATAFAQGFGQAVSQSGQEVVSGGNGSYLISNPALSTKSQLYVAGGNAAGAVGENLNRLFGNRAPTIKVASGTAVGILFLPTGSY